MHPYEPQNLEPKILQQWQQAKLFQTPPASELPPYCIPLPPPNVTGTLHMGHAFQQTLMDILLRFHRMKGYRVHWQVGTDHAGIATQLVVEKKLREQGLEPKNLSQEAFLEQVMQWKEQSSQIIFAQMQRLGLHIAPETARFTLDERYRQAVTQAFIGLYRAGLIYRGLRLVNWDPKLKTAISDLEVNLIPCTKTLYEIQYRKRGQAQATLTVATTRPETLFGDVAIAVHPDDPRYQGWIGQTVDIPCAERAIPVVAHPSVDPDYGTGAVKITPAHDFLDEKIAKSLGLPSINIFDEAGCFLKQAEVYPSLSSSSELRKEDWIPMEYQGLAATEVRERLCERLKAEGAWVRSRSIEGSLPVGERSGAIIEPRLTFQWFLKTQSLSELAKADVQDGKVRFHPKHYEKLFFSWMDSLEDWCISRQVAWGHPLPVWWNSSRTQCFVGDSEAEIRERENLLNSNLLFPESDVLDTWFSASLWTFASLGWPQNTEYLQAFHPTQVVVSGFDILYFWIARMMMMTSKLQGEIPFRDVIITGLIRDEQGAKMSKSKGNVLDPIDVIEGITLQALIQKREKDTLSAKDRADIRRRTTQYFPQGFQAFGADALRITLASLANQSRDVHWSTQRLRGYRNFCNKLWNAFQLIARWSQQLGVHPEKHAGSLGLEPLTLWVQQAWSCTLSEIQEHLESYRFDCAVQLLYDFVWHQFCDWHLEMVKPLVYAGAPCRFQAFQGVVQQFQSLLQVLHPFIPFITEALWQQLFATLGVSRPSEYLIQSPWPSVQPLRSVSEEQAELLHWMDWMKSSIEAYRSWQAQHASFKPIAIGFELPERELITQTFKKLFPTWKSLLKTEVKLENSSQAVDSVILRQDGFGCVILHGCSLSHDQRAQQLRKLKQNFEHLQVQEAELQSLLGNMNFQAKAPPEVVQSKKAEQGKLGIQLKQLQSQITELQIQVDSNSTL